jgi:spore maturation protein CgeB
VVAEHVANTELRKIYSSVKVVLADHWDDMREHGFISNRIYDALACGATVLCDEVNGLAGRFGESVVTYRDPTDLRNRIEELCSGEPPSAHARAGTRQQILSEGTFEQRVSELLEHVEAHRLAAGHRRRVLQH